MKKTLLLSIMLLLGVLSAMAQDVIYFRNQEIVQAKVIEITLDLVKYQLYDFEGGPVISVRKSDLLKIEFENGTVLDFNSKTAAKLEISPYTRPLKWPFCTAFRLFRSDL